MKKWTAKDIILIVIFSAIALGAALLLKAMWTTLFPGFISFIEDTFSGHSANGLFGWSWHI